MLFFRIVVIADDLVDIAFSARIAIRLDDQIEGFCDLQFDHFDRKIDSIAHHRGQATDRLFGRIGMQCCERSVMTGVHGLQHVECFATTAFAHNNAIRPHAERIDY